MKAGSVVAFALPIAAMTGCLLTTSLDGIVGTKTGPTPTQDATDESNLVLDSAKPSDSAVDSGSALDSSFCTLQAHTFCADFDRDPKVQAGWGSISNASGTGTVSLDTTTFVTAPAAAKFEAPTDCLVLDAFSLGKTGTKKLHFAADIQVAVSSSSFVTVTFFSLGAKNDQFLLVGPDQTLFYGENQTQSDGGIAFQSYASGKLPLLQWARVKIDITVGDPSTVAVSIAGAPTFSGATKLIVADTPIELQIGACTKNVSGGTILFDNVTLDLEY